MRIWRSGRIEDDVAEMRAADVKSMGMAAGARSDLHRKRMPGHCLAG
jgi:hypothetical protein